MIRLLARTNQFSKVSNYQSVHTINMLQFPRNVEVYWRRTALRWKERADKADHKVAERLQVRVLEQFGCSTDIIDHICNFTHNEYWISLRSPESMY